MMIEKNKMIGSAGSKNIQQKSKQNMEEDICKRLKEFLNDEDNSKKLNDQILRRNKFINIVKFLPTNQIVFGTSLKHPNIPIKNLDISRLSIDETLIEFLSKNFDNFNIDIAKIIEDNNKSQICNDKNMNAIFMKLIQESVLKIKLKLEDLMEIFKDREGDICEYIKTYLILFIFFEYFIVYRDDNLHILNIRSEIVKHCLSGDSSQCEIMKEGKIYTEFESLNEIFQKIIFSLKICDFEKLYKQCKIVSDTFSQNNNSVFANCYLDVKNIFNNLSRIFEGYAKLLSNKLNITERNKNELIRFNNMKINECKQSLEELKNQNYDDKIANLYEYICQILNIIQGDLKSIKIISSNFYHILMMFVYYNAIYYEDKSDLSISDDENKNKFSELKDHFNQIDNENYETYILLSAITENPVLFCYKIDKNFPSYIHFHICSYLQHIYRFPIEKTYDDIFQEFIEYLMCSDYTFQININYFSVFNSDQRTINFILDYFSHKAIISIFKLAEMNNYSYPEALVDKIKNICDLIVKFKNTKRIELSIYRYCGIKFFEARLFDLAVMFIYNKIGDKSFYNLFARLIIELFLGLEDKDLSYYENSMKIDTDKMNNPQIFDSLLKVDKKTLNQLSELKFILKYQRIIKLYEHLIHGKDLYSIHKIKNKISKFFNFCFVQKKCPNLLFIRTVGLFEKIFSRFKEIFIDLNLEDVKSAFILINTKSIKYEINNYLKRFEINKDKSDVNNKFVLHDLKNNLDLYLKDAVDFIAKLEDYLILCR